MRQSDRLEFCDSSTLEKIVIARVGSGSRGWIFALRRHFSLVRPGLFVGYTKNSGRLQACHSR